LRLLGYIALHLTYNHLVAGRSPVTPRAGAAIVRDLLCPQTPVAIARSFAPIHGAIGHAQSDFSAFLPGWHR